METFRDRLILEKKELDKKIEKLESFLLSDLADSIEPFQVSMLNIQVGAMLTYMQCLEERLIWLVPEPERSV